MTPQTTSKASLTWGSSIESRHTGGTAATASQWNVAWGLLTARLRSDDRHLNMVKSFVLESLAECDDLEAARLRLRVQMASSAQSLLELREVLFSRIARARWQGVAIEFLTRFDQIMLPASAQLRRRRAAVR